MPSILDCRIVSEEFVAELKGKNSARITWRVRTDGRMPAADVLYQALTAADEPVLSVGTYIGNGVYVLQTPIRLEHPGNKTQWTVTAECGPWPTTDAGAPGDGIDPNTGQVNPLQRRVIWSIERYTEQEAVEVDTSGNPIVNAAGKPFDIPYFRERHYPVLVAVKNFATLDEIIAINEAYENHLNSIPFKGYGKWFVKFTGAEASQAQYENGITFYTATMRFPVRKTGEFPDYGWQPEILNRGYQYFDIDKSLPNAKLKTVGDGLNQPASEPANLALDGTLLPVDGVPTKILFEAYNDTDQFAVITADP